MRLQGSHSGTSNGVKLLDTVMLPVSPWKGF